MNHRHSAWLFETRRGPVTIERTPDGRYVLFFEDESLGSYHTPEAAADDAAVGATFLPPSGTSLGTLGISPDLAEWEPLKQSER